MPTLELVRGKQRQINSEEAKRITEILVSDSKPEFVKIQGKPIRVSKIVDIDDSDLEQKKVSRQLKKEQRDELKKVQKERDQFKQRRPEDKTKFWFYNVFMTKYLYQEGYKRVLGANFERKQNTRRREKFDRYLDEDYRNKVIATSLKWYRNNEDKIFPPRKVYAKFLPTKEEAIEGFKKI